MALQSRINEIYPNRKPFMETAEGKRKAAGPDLRVQTLRAQAAAKRQCTDGTILQEQQPPAQDHMQQQENANPTAPTDFSGFYNQLQREKQQSNNSDSIPQQSAQQWQQQQHQLDNTLQQHLHQHDAPEQQQQDAAGGFSDPLEDLQQRHHQQHQQHHSAAPTLDQLLNEHDLNSRHKPPDRELKQMMSLERIVNVDASPDGFIRGQPDQTAAAGLACNRSNSSATAAAAAAAAAAREQHSWHVTDVPYIPWDWSVKSSVRLSSAAPFNVLEEGQAGGMEGMCHALAAAGGAAAPAAADAAASKQARLQQALMQWQHPASALPPALLVPQATTTSSSAAAAAAAAADPAALLLHERAQHWREALRSAYISLRHGHCPVVYICGQAFKQPFTAVLCAPGVIGPSSSGSNGSSSSSSSGVTALLSRSNRQLRAHLAAYGCEGVVAGQLEQQAAASAQQQQPQRKQQQQQQQLPAGAFDGQPGSQLLLLGAFQVHSLYAALLALPWCEPGQPDVPMLSAPVHFLHAQLCPLRLVALPDALLDQQQQQRPAAAPGGVDAAVPQPLHYVELRAPGSIMPWTLHRLLAVMQDTQGLEGFQAYFGTEPCSSSLNVLPELWAAAAALVAGGGGAGSSRAGVNGANATAAGGDQDKKLQQQPWQREGRGFVAAEVGSWDGSAVLLHGWVLRQLRVEDGSVAAKLA